MHLYKSFLHYSVRLESDLQDITTLELETLLEGATYTIDQTIRASCKYLTMLPQSWSVFLKA